MRSTMALSGVNPSSAQISARLARPDAGQRIEAVGQRLAEHDDVGLDAEMLDRPQLAGAEETHLDLVDHQQDAVAVQHLLELDEEILRRNYVAAGALDWLDVERGIFGLAGLGIPDAVVFALEQALERSYAVEAVFLLAHALRSPEVIGERHELRAVAEMPVAAAITVGRGDRRGAQRAAVIAALEGEHQAFSVRGIAHELERILDRLRAADVEMHADLETELGLGIARDQGGELDLLAMEILARHLRQLVDLPLERVVEPTVAVAEIDRRVPHLQVEVLAPGAVIEKGALAALEQFRRVGVVDRIAMRAIERLELEKLGFLGGRRIGADGALRGELKRRAHRPDPRRHAALAASARRSIVTEWPRPRRNFRTAGERCRHPRNARSDRPWPG